MIWGKYRVNLQVERQTICTSIQVMTEGACRKKPLTRRRWRGLVGDVGRQIHRCRFCRSECFDFDGTSVKRRCNTSFDRIYVWKKYTVVTKIICEGNRNDTRQKDGILLDVDDEKRRNCWNIRAIDNTSTILLYARREVVAWWVLIVCSSCDWCSGCACELGRFIGSGSL